MDQKSDRTDQAASVPSKGQTRDDRLKSALKANMARRKAQAKARDTSVQDQEKE